MGNTNLKKVIPNRVCRTRNSDLGELFDDLCELFDGLVRISVFDTFPYAVVDVSFEDDLTDFVDSALDRIDLHHDLFAGYILIDHAVNC